MPWRRTAGRRGLLRRWLRRSGTRCRCGRGRRGCRTRRRGRAGRWRPGRQSAMKARDRDITIRTVAAVLWASERSSARVWAHWRAPAASRIRSGTSGWAPATPGGDGAQVVAGQGGGVEVAAQVVTGFGGPERAVFDALLGDGERERVGAADGGGRVLASGHRVPAEGGGNSADGGPDTWTRPCSARTALVRW